ncbi:hypothetical protein QTP86_018106 [Hemibagrus guttatus]|nr:hypothetical protein QTP86_018106 [Hemibagrus guttatus]
MVLLEKYNGSVDRCRGFLRQCEIFFSHQPDMYREEGTKCAFMFLLLTGRALDWASTVWDMDPQIRTCFMCFTGMVCEVFENPAGAIRLDNLHHQHRASTRPSLPAHALAESSSPREEYPKSMQLGRSRVSEQECQSWTHMRLCFYCRISGHQIHQCPDRPSSSQVESPDIDTPAHVPWDYRDLREVFSKEKATSLPEHRPWDCAIDLFPNTTPPNSRVYPLSLLETNAMDEYIEEALAMGHIRPSTSPVVAVFLHGEKGKRMRVNVPALITEDSKPSPSITPTRSRWYRQH